MYLFRNVANKFIEFLIKENEEIDHNALSDVFPASDKDENENENDDLDDDDDELEEPDEDDPDKPDEDDPPIPPPKTEKLLKPFKNLNRFLIDLTEATFSDYEGCEIDTSSIGFNSFKLTIREESFNLTIEGLEPAYAYACRYENIEDDL